MEIEFSDIKIVGMEDDMTVESHNNPALRYIYLRLSQTPPPLWQKYFTESRKVPRHTKWRHVWIDRKFLVVECVPDEIETHHLRDLKQDVARANEQFRVYLQHQVRAESNTQKMADLEKERLRDLKSRLKFD